MDNCKICGSKTDKIFTCKVLNKHDVDYFKCSNCEFIQTENPYWLEEAYSSVITSLDIGLISRNINNVPVVSTLIKVLYKKDKEYLDYGGGYGMFVRMMRDNGFSYYRQDLYCENLFAKNFDVDDIISSIDKFELLTAFEVFEHLVDPVSELKKMLSYSDNIFFTTTVYPKNTDLISWWYLIPETGQHVALYSHKSLKHLAKINDLHYYNFGDTYHLFTKKSFPNKLFESIFSERFQKYYNKISSNPVSLLQSDFNMISSIKM
ncbi:class I SAM-dependent methyltransferase [Hymenobacter tibetensis]|uniref:Class I SAM-dependent methyltransferase n=1 Tax=Hymenobacter tibetensis TaxID=497967 RepID=A0ABY4D462_9BACT|nr:class I SAM-dependent methyltransferase [Hymenobacter tibetensis]UOG75941.1 class I SAM-dependent methyltransferase [Hymenobacter tibetensis]